MSFLAMAWATKQSPETPTQRLILLHLASMANQDGISWPSYNHLADVCGLDRSTVIRNIKKLESLGFLAVRKRKVSSDENKSNVYQLSVGGGGGTVPLGGGGTAPPIYYNSLETVKMQPPDADASLYESGKKLLGQKSGGMITKLKTAYGIQKAQKILDTAKGRQDPREYIGAVLKDADRMIALPKDQTAVQKYIASNPGCIPKKLESGHWSEAWKHITGARA